MTRLAFLSALVISAHAIPASRLVAQPDLRRPEIRSIYDVKAGARIRITTLNQPPERVKARFVGLRDNMLSVDTGRATREFALGSVLRVEETYADRKRGAIAGVITAAVLVYARDFFGPPHKYVDQGKRYRENAVVLVAATGAGALIGGSIGWKRWRSIPTLYR